MKILEKKPKIFNEHHVYYTIRQGPKKVLNCRRRLFPLFLIVDISYTIHIYITCIYSYIYVCIFISQSESFSHNLSRIKKAVLFVSLSVCQSCSVASSRLPRRRVYCVAEPLNNLKTHKNLIKQPLKIIIKIIIIIIIICPSIRSV